MKSIKIATFSVAVAAITSLMGATSLGLNRARAPSLVATFAAGPGIHAATVRAEYANVNNREAYTTCRLTNLSISQDLVLKQVVVLGAGGTGSIMTVYNGLFNQALPPLGSLDLRIDNLVAGVVQQTTPNGPAVRQVVFLWEGDAEAMSLSASIESWFNAELRTRTERTEVGLPLQP